MEETNGNRVYRVGELAKLSGIPASTLRLWTQRGLIGSHKTKGGHRLFTDRDLRWVMQARDLTQGRYMTDQLANTINSLVEVDDKPIKLTEPPPVRALRHDPNYERMLDLAAQNARLFVEQRELASKLAELAAALAAAEERYASTVARIAECLWSVEVDDEQAFHFQLCTPAIEKITGYPAQAFFDDSRNWLDIVHPDDQPRMRDVFSKAIQGQALEEEYRIVRADGAERWVRCSIRPSVNESGRVVRLDGVLSDITESKLAELSLRASEEKLRLVVESFPDSILTLDKDLRYVTVLNPIGCKEEDMVGLTAKDIHAPEVAEHLNGIRRQVLETGQCVRARVKIILGGQPRYRDMIVTPLKRNGGEIDGVITYSRDITEQVLIEQELRASLEAARKSEALSRSIVDSLHIPIWLIDRDGNTLYANRAFTDLIGYQGPEPLTKSAEELLAEIDDRPVEGFIANCFDGANRATEARLLTVAGHALPVALRITRLPDVNGTAAVALEVISGGSTSLVG